MNINTLKNRLVKKANMQKVAGPKANAIRALIHEFRKAPKEVFSILMAEGKRSSKQLPLSTAIAKDKTIENQLNAVTDRFGRKLQYHQRKNFFGGDGLDNVPAILSSQPNTLNDFSKVIKGFTNQQLKNLVEIANTMRM
jgi:hypothetical protein